MRAALVFAFLLVATASTRAEILECRPNSWAEWMLGEARAFGLERSDPASAGFTIDLRTGAFHQNWSDGTDPVDVVYDILTRGHYADESDWIGFDAGTYSLIRIRLTNEELQFMRDYDRQVEIGTCSFISHQDQYLGRE